MVLGFQSLSRPGRTVAALALIGLPVVAAGCVDIAATSLYVDREERRFDVQTAPDLTVDTFDGSIDVESWDRPEVLVVVEKRGRDRDAASAIQVDWNQDGERISVKVRGRARDRVELFLPDRQSARLIVTVPRNTRVKATSGDGRIEIRRVAGGVSAHTDDGSIRLYDVDGDVDVTTDDGSIRVDGILSDLRARSDDGSVRVRAQPGSATESDWRIATDDGSIVLELPGDFGAELDAHTEDGRIVVRDLDFEHGDRSRWKHGTRGRLGRGGKRLNIDSGDGSITVRRY
jgi:hypothetical protein